MVSKSPRAGCSQVVDIVALGTVCDIVPLQSLNQTFIVARGLELVARRGNLGIAALCDQAKVIEMPEAWHLDTF